MAAAAIMREADLFGDFGPHVSSFKLTSHTLASHTSHVRVPVCTHRVAPHAWLWAAGFVEASTMLGMEGSLCQRPCQGH